MELCNCSCRHCRQSRQKRELLNAVILQLVSGFELAPNSAHTALVQESFQVVSGMYPSAEAWVTGSFDVAQNVLGLVAWSKSVPPTAVLNGVEESPLT